VFVSANGINTLMAILSSPDPRILVCMDSLLSFMSFLSQTLTLTLLTYIDGHISRSSHCRLLLQILSQVSEISGVCLLDLRALLLLVLSD
jgi:hypothetical protein